MIDNVILVVVKYMAAIFDKCFPMGAHRRERIISCIVIDSYQPNIEYWVLVLK